MLPSISYITLLDQGILWNSLLIILIVLENGVSHLMSPESDLIVLVLIFFMFVVGYALWCCRANKARSEERRGRRRHTARAAHFSG